MIAALLARIYPACAATGTLGLPIPDPVHFARLADAAAGAGALAAPADFEVPADIVTPRYDAAPETVFAALLRIGTIQPRSWLAAAYPTRLQAHFVVRSAWLNFPEIIVAEAREAGAGSVAVIFSQSVYGRSHASAHRRRLQDWLAALNAVLMTEPKGRK